MRDGPVSTTSVRREEIAESLQDKEYRDLFLAEEIDTMALGPSREVLQTITGPAGIPRNRAPGTPTCVSTQTVD